MPLYHILFLTHGDETFGSEQFAAEHDAAAIDRAKTVYRSRIGRGLELWRGEDHLHTETY